MRPPARARGSPERSSGQPVCLDPFHRPRERLRLLFEAQSVFHSVLPTPHAHRLDESCRFGRPPIARVPSARARSFCSVNRPKDTFTCLRPSSFLDSRPEGRSIPKDAVSPKRLGSLLHSSSTWPRRTAPLSRDPTSRPEDRSAAALVKRAFRGDLPCELRSPSEDGSLRSPGGGLPRASSLRRLRRRARFHRGWDPSASSGPA